MPWKEETAMSLRGEFVEQARQEGANVSELCRGFGISRTTGYKWLRRYSQEGRAGLSDRSRRPKSSPRRTCAALEADVLQVRGEHPTWGGRKIKAHLERKGHHDLPAPSTIGAILKRRELVEPEESRKHKPYERFEREKPNELWQMDFKGHFALAGGGRCHPLTVLDDHSRFLLGLQACADETRETVQEQLAAIFRLYGLPEVMLMDNGSPWGDRAEQPFTVLVAWLMRLGIRVTHGRPYHPQTQGKDERLHRTLNEELLQRRVLHDLEESQRAFDAWRLMYNTERPHEALGLAVPAERYTPSPRAFPEALPPIVYDSGSIVRRVDEKGRISFHNRPFRVGRAFAHQPVALAPDDQDGDFVVSFCRQHIARISLREEYS